MWIHSNFSSSQRSFGVLKGTRRISGNCDTWRDPMRYKLSWDWCRTSCQQEAITPTGAVLLSAQHTTALTTGTSLDEMSRSPTHGVGAQKSAVFSAIFEEPISSPHGPEESVLPGAFPNHTSRPQKRAANLFSTQTIEFSTRPRMSNTSRRRVQLCIAHQLCPNESLCHTSSKPSVVSTRCRSNALSGHTIVPWMPIGRPTPHTTKRKAWQSTPV